MENNIEKGTYEIIQQRLNQQRLELVQSINDLNSERKKIFGSVDFKLMANVRISTEHNCIARDIVAIGNQCLFGYNVRLGLKSVLEISDVFSVYKFEEGVFKPALLSIIENNLFAQELQDLYKFYRNTQFARFLVKDNYLYMIFHLSDTVSDIKAFKWLIEQDQLVYIDSRSAAEVKFPLQHEFEWTKATRDMQRTGKNPHVSIVDKVFVETVGGDLTIKVEDNTNDGQGIYNELVEHPDQSLDDAEIHFCDLGNLILLKIRPYLETDRYFIFNHRMKTVMRVDTLKDATILLPEQQGIMVSNGYYLQTGEHKIFDRVIEGVKFLRKVASPNGEDFLYVFYEEKNHDFVILSYNVIDQSLKSPIVCNGYTLLKNGELCFFNTENNPSKNHLVQIWQTPFTFELIPDANYIDNEIYKIGNKSIVKAMAECQELTVLLSKEDSFQGLYQLIQQKTQSIQDAYFWIKNEKVSRLNQPLEATKNIAINAIDEYEKVVQIKKNTNDNFTIIASKVEKLLFATKSAQYDNLSEYVQLLAQMRTIRGEIIGLKNLRYIDLEKVTQIELQIADRSDAVSQSCVSFLLQENALRFYQENVSKVQDEIENLTKVIEANALEKEIDEQSHQLELLIDIVNNLKVDDKAHATVIIENISLIFSQLNQQRILLKNRKTQLSQKEATADFHAQMTLFEQSVINYLDLANVPDKCDEYLTKLTLNLEELEGKYADFDVFVEQIIVKRENIFAAFDSKKIQLVEAKNKKSNALLSSAQRMLKSIQSRANSFDTDIEINGYFASDLMIEKVRNIAKQLQDLTETAKSEDIFNQIQVLQQEAIRALKDKKELFEDGDHIIKLGDYRFAVNNQKTDLSLVNKDGKFYYHISGTSFYELVQDETLINYKSVWDQELVSENQSVRRAEYLAWKIFQNNSNVDSLTDDDCLQLIQDNAKNHYGEGYVKGVHDADALLILKTIVHTKKNLGLLSYHPSERVAAQYFWHFSSDLDKQIFKKQFKSAATLDKFFTDKKNNQFLVNTLSQSIEKLQIEKRLGITFSPTQAAFYLITEQASEGFVISPEAKAFYDQFFEHLNHKNARFSFDEFKIELSPNSEALWFATRQWILTVLSELNQSIEENVLIEVIIFVITHNIDKLNAKHAPNHVIIQSIKSIQNHDQTSNHYYFNYHEFTHRLSEFCSVTQPIFIAFQKRKQELAYQKREELKLHEFQSNVLSSFVRNKLINQVYLPLIGSNFAKQMGAYGQDNRSDRSGMLLLVSPPGYGKTTLMEYVSNRLGLIFVKINGPSLGHQITSVDPTEAKNAAARQELVKLNLAFEMGDNIMLYLDDIQHCNPEFLQKFISLADGQRKMDGVYKNQPKTYDFKGKRFCIVMAGNPYTESGDKFQIPDMLSNRADIYNLGDTATHRLDLFQLSLLENGLTSNSYLKMLTKFSLDNLYKLIQMIENNEQALPDLDGNLSNQEIQDCVNVLKKAIFIRDVVLKVNAQYIASAAMSDEFREEPPFKLQGSYRDMNKLMGQLVPIQNDREVVQLLLNHYQNESQTLTSDAEANLLKLQSLINQLNTESDDRWAYIKKTFKNNRSKDRKGVQNSIDELQSQAVLLTEALNGIKHALESIIDSKK